MDEVESLVRTVIRQAISHGVGQFVVIKYQSDPVAPIQTNEADEEGEQVVHDMVMAVMRRVVFESDPNAPTPQPVTAAVEAPTATTTTAEVDGAVSTEGNADKDQPKVEKGGDDEVVTASVVIAEGPAAKVEKGDSNEVVTASVIIAEGPADQDEDEPVATLLEITPTRTTTNSKAMNGRISFSTNGDGRKSTGPHVVNVIDSPLTELPAAKSNLQTYRQQYQTLFYEKQAHMIASLTLAESDIDYFIEACKQKSREQSEMDGVRGALALINITPHVEDEIKKGVPIHAQMEDIMNALHDEFEAVVVTWQRSDSEEDRTSYHLEQTAMTEFVDKLKQTIPMYSHTPTYTINHNNTTPPTDTFEIKELFKRAWALTKEGSTEFHRNMHALLHPDQQPDELIVERGFVVEDENGAVRTTIQSPGSVEAKKKDDEKGDDDEKKVGVIEEEPKAAVVADEETKVDATDAVVAAAVVAPVVAEAAAEEPKAVVEEPVVVEEKAPEPVVEEPKAVVEEPKAVVEEPKVEEPKADEAKAPADEAPAVDEAKAVDAEYVLVDEDEQPPSSAADEPQSPQSSSSNKKAQQNKNNNKKGGKKKGRK